MDFSTTIQGFNQEYNLNAINDYNKFLKGQASFEFEPASTDFEKALEVASKSAPLKDKHDPAGMGNFMGKLETGFGNSLNAINNMRLEADRMQEDLAMGGPTSIHEAMIAAEKAELSMQMAIQVRNRILNAYTEINSMGL